MAAISEDPIINIFCRLPVKTLLHFRCVSKQFHSIIDNPNFINHHLQNHRSLNRSRRRLIVDSITELFSIDLDSTDNAFKLKLPFENRGSHARVIGSCDGLLALSIYFHISICLRNISTRKHHIFSKFWSDSNLYVGANVFNGFGYDVATHGYKLVRVINGGNYMTHVFVYSLKANSWSRIENYPPYQNYTVCSGFLPFAISNNDVGVLVCSALNWMVGVFDIDDCRVLSFDLKDEKFYKVLLPNIWDEAKARFRMLTLEGCLCFNYISPSDFAVDIWVMKNFA